MTDPVPNFDFKIKEVNNVKQEKDQILIIEVEPSVNYLIFTANKEVYLRIGDKSLRQTYEQTRKLEFDKGQRKFEDIEISESSIEDVDEELMMSYKEIKGAESIDTEQRLTARGLMKNGKLTNAGMLLFGKNTFLYLPHSRIRFLRYDGRKSKTGQRLNIVKEFDYDGPIPLLIDKITKGVTSQLREFQYLGDDGKFKVIPEYPEFAWFEGIVNALTHRDYSYQGDYVRIKMYDDRLEIFSPGPLPNVVTLENMRNTRYARNTRIARVLSEFGWVQEMNEGVNRIYDEMHLFFLNEPIYSEPNNNSVQLVLDNSITSRHLRSSDRINEFIGNLTIKDLKPEEKRIIAFLYNNNAITLKETNELLGRSPWYSRNVLRGLIDNDIIRWIGNNPQDPTQYYELNR